MIMIDEMKVLVRHRERTFQNMKKLRLYLEKLESQTYYMMQVKIQDYMLKKYCHFSQIMEFFFSYVQKDSSWTTKLTLKEFKEDWSEVKDIVRLYQTNEDKWQSHIKFADRKLREADHLE